jgi:hypothetical protein
MNPALCCAEYLLRRSANFHAYATENHAPADNNIPNEVGSGTETGGVAEVPN